MRVLSDCGRPLLRKSENTETFTKEEIRLLHFRPYHKYNYYFPVCNIFLHQILGVPPNSSPEHIWIVLDSENQRKRWIYIWHKWAKCIFVCVWRVKRSFRQVTFSMTAVLWVAWVEHLLRSSYHKTPAWISWTQGVKERTDPLHINWASTTPSHSKTRKGRRTLFSIFTLKSKFNSNLRVLVAALKVQCLRLINRNEI